MPQYFRISAVVASPGVPSSAVCFRIASGVSSDSAFFKCTQLEFVRIPDSVKIIGKWVFHGCNRLKVLEIPGDPEVVGDWIVNRSCTIRCRKGSKIDKYCQLNDFLCEYL